LLRCVYQVRLGQKSDRHLELVGVDQRVGQRAYPEIVPADRDNDAMRQWLALYKLTDLAFVRGLVEFLVGYLNDFSEALAAVPHPALGRPDPDACADDRVLPSRPASVEGGAGASHLVDPTTST
jgi:hypothetical protein